MCPLAIELRFRVGKVAKEEREVRHYRKYLTDLTKSVRHFLYLLDEEMKKPSSVDRGKRIAALANDLNFKNDEARYFGLQIDYRKDKPIRMKEKTGKRKEV